MQWQLPLKFLGCAVDINTSDRIINGQGLILEMKNEMIIECKCLLNNIGGGVGGMFHCT
jgi:hypothetical protein